MEKTKNSAEEAYLKEMEVRKEAFLSEYRALCNRTGFVLSPVMIMKSNGVIPELEVLPHKN